MITHYSFREDKTITRKLLRRRRYRLTKEDRNRLQQEYREWRLTQETFSCLRRL